MDAARRADHLRWLRSDDLRGANLRYCLLTLMADSGRPCSIADLRARLEQRGLAVGGRDPSKTIADVLRYECRSGRVRRTARGWYQVGHRPDTTARRHRDRLRDLMQEGIRRRAAGDAA